MNPTHVSLRSLLLRAALLLLASLGAGATGCAAKRSVWVYADARPREESVAYVTVEPDPAWNFADLAPDGNFEESFGRYRNAVRVMLEDAGYTVLNEPGGVDAIVLLGYGVTGAIAREQHPPEPVFAGREDRREPAFTPRLDDELGGGRDFHYSRLASLRAIEPEEADAPERAESIWLLELESVGPFRRLEETFPLLLHAGREWVGRDVERRILVGVRGDAPGATRLRRAMKITRPEPNVGEPAVGGIRDPFGRSRALDRDPGAERGAPSPASPSR